MAGAQSASRCFKNHREDFQCESSVEREAGEVAKALEECGDVFQNDSVCDRSIFTCDMSLRWQNDDLVIFGMIFEAKVSMAATFTQLENRASG